MTSTAQHTAGARLVVTVPAARGQGAGGSQASNTFCPSLPSPRRSPGPSQGRGRPDTDEPPGPTPDASPAPLAGQQRGGRLGPRPRPTARARPCLLCPSQPCILPSPSPEASLILSAKATALAQPPACDRKRFWAPLKSRRHWALGTTPVRADDPLKAVLSQASPKTTGGRAVGEACATWRALGQESRTPETPTGSGGQGLQHSIPGLVPSAGAADRGPGARLRAAGAPPA